jgi:hypothetical protein
MSPVGGEGLKSEFHRLQRSQVLSHRGGTGPLSTATPPGPPRLWSGGMEGSWS